MEDKIGPTLHIIPEQRIYSCWGCKYFKHQMVQSGFHPIYESSCLKMNYEGTVLSDEEVKVNTIPLTIQRAHKETKILVDAKSPPYCPYLKSEERNDKLNNIGI
jgi:hypothetical protein